MEIAHLKKQSNEHSNNLSLEHKLIVGWVTEGSSVLDLGCGDGELLSILVNEKKVLAQGTEIDEQAIYKCVARGLSVYHEDVDAGLSEHPDGSFDFVILSQSLQQTKRPDYVLSEALRVGKNLIVSFPNFGRYNVRLQILFTGKVPVTPALPYEWFDTPNLHFLSISNFLDYCKMRKIIIRDSAFVANGKKISALQNLRADTGVFLLSK
jgi:methionine biosynthesis protein MetW